MRKLFAPRTVLTATFTLLVTSSLFVLQACTSGEGATPTCTQDVDKDGHQNVENPCNPFAVCRANPLDENSPQLPAEECCKDADGKPFTGQELQLCLYGYGEDADLSTSASAGGGGDDGGGGGK